MTGAKVCGFAGILVYNPEGLKQKLVYLSTSLRHRGPDDVGFLLWDGKTLITTKEPMDGHFLLGLVHRRLAIIDISDAGWQPMSSQDNMIHIVYNGEIYNYIELKNDLQKKGYSFKSSSDTEVLIVSYQEWGIKAIDRFIGMYAFALLDLTRDILLLVRDPFGIKPLYFTSNYKGFFFSSEIPPLLEISGVSRSVDPDRLYMYLRFGITDYGDRTLFKEIHQVPAGHYIKVSLKDLSWVKGRYFDLEIHENSFIPYKQAASLLREHFFEAVRLHMRSDVPVGSALSGGIDSASILRMMRKVEPDNHLHAFSFIADHPKISEEKYIDQIGAETGAIVHKIRILPEEILSDINRLIRIQGEPFGSTSIYAQYRIFKEASKNGIKVMLDGQGADELLGGYVTYNSAMAASLLIRGRINDFVSLLRATYNLPNRHRIWAKTIFYFLPKFLQKAAMSVAREPLFPKWMSIKWFRQRSVFASFPSSAKPFKGSILQQELIHTLFQSTLPMLLRYEDRNSMAHSVESRVPFLTVPLARFILSLPEEYIISPEGISKYVFRTAMNGLVPKEILERRDKIGFATPELNWLNALSPWVDKQLQKIRVIDIPVLNFNRIQYEWNTAKRNDEYFDFRVWRWINLILWAEAFEVTF